MKRQQYSNLRNDHKEAALINKSSLEARKIEKKMEFISVKRVQQ